MIDVEAIRAKDAYRSPELIASLRNLTLRDKGVMEHLLDACTPGWFFLGWNGHELVGWASITPCYSDSCSDRFLQVFVAPRNRRRGYGGIIVRYAISFARKKIRRVLVCSPYDKQAISFFSKTCVLSLLTPRDRTYHIGKLK